MTQIFSFVNITFNFILVQKMLHYDISINIPYIYIYNYHYTLLMAHIRNSPIPASATASTSVLEHPFALVCANAFDGVA